MNEKQLQNEKSSSNANNEQSKVQSKKKRKKPRRKVGRKRIRRRFEETRVGYFLRLEAPLEYNLIMDVSGSVSAPSADLIEAIGYASLNFLFKKPKFRRALIEYRKNGLYAERPKECSVEKELYYMKVRKNNVQKVMRKNLHGFSTEQFLL